MGRGPIGMLAQRGMVGKRRAVRQLVAVMLHWLRSHGAIRASRASPGQHCLPHLYFGLFDTYVSGLYRRVLDTPTFGVKGMAGILRF
jgi:hypothetical protein